MNEAFWNGRLDFLKAIRTGWWNDDYFEFLVSKVWKINRPVNIIDFGCGFGYIGMMLMPLIPEGSTYTGIDISNPLLDEAKAIFGKMEYRTRFIKADLNEYEPDSEYDIAVCQAVLRHLPGAKNVLGKMVRSVSKGGMVICFETNREMENAGIYFSGLDYAGLGKTALLQKQWRTEYENGGRDYCFGIKIPIYMQDMGLHDVDVRVNDRVKFINPFGDQDNFRELSDTVSAASGWDRELKAEEEIDYTNGLMNKGFTKEEAEKYIVCEKKIAEYIMKNRDTASIIMAPCMIISYGTK